MEVKQITFTEREIWNKFVAQTSEAPVLQSFEWGEVKARFGWEPIRMAVEDQGELIAGISILKRKVPYTGCSMFYAPRGPVFNIARRHDDNEIRKIIEFLLSAVERQSDQYRAISLKIDPAISERRKDVIEIMKILGFVKSPKQIQPRATILLNLRPELEKILMGFAEKTRYNIRLAEKRGVVIQENSGRRGVDLFYEMYQETARRNSFLIHPLKYYQTIREIMFEKGLGANFIAYYKHQPIAAVIVFCFGEKIWYMYGASSSEYRKVMPNHLLHWHIIKWAKEKGFKTYDLWGIPVNPKEGHPLWGVYRFKSGFNGKTIKYIGAYDFPYSPLFYNVLEYGVLWWRNIRSLLTKGRIEDSLSE